MLRYDIRRNGKWMFSQGPSEATGEKKVVLCQFKLLTTDAQQAPDMSQTLDAVGPADAIVAGRFVETRPGDTFELRVSGVVPDPDYLRSAEAQQERVTEGQQNLYCSFCGKSQHEVKKLIAGPGRLHLR